MTMKITIKNEGPAPYHAKVTISDIGRNEDGSEKLFPANADAVTLAPGESHEVYVHSTRCLRVEETIPEAKPAPEPEKAPEPEAAQE